MPSRIETAIARYRSALDREDAEAQARLVRAYQAGQKRIQRRLDALAPLLADEPTPGRVFADARYRALLAQIEGELASLGAQLVTETTARQGTLVEATGDAARTLVAAQRPELAADFARLPTRATQELVGSLADGSPLAETVGRRFGEARTAAEEALAAGIIAGEGPAVLARTLAGLTDGLMARHVMTLARTAPLQAFRTASLLTYAENADVLSGWQWAATLSPTTCLACLNKHGTVYPLSVQFFGTHPRCRCSPVPIVRGRRALPLESGKAWFDRQPVAVQRRQMGERAWQSYQAGEIRFADFLGERDDPDWGAQIYERSLAEMLRRGVQRPAA